MNTYITVLLATVATLLPITNPLGNAAIFLSITEGDTSAERRTQALKGAIYMFGILCLFFLAGTLIMDFFGLTLEGIRIAGGMVIVKVGFNLLTPKVEHTHTPEEHAEAKTKDDIAFSPLAIPLLSGPGAIAAIMGLAANLPVRDMVHQGVVVIGILLVCLACWLVLRESERLLGLLGVNGANALTKIMGFLLLCMGVQLAIAGITALKFG
jgi:multiple antibiotic resistance protein